MKIANIGRFIAFVVIIGLAIGAYRLYQTHGKMSFTMPSFNGTMPSFNGGGSGAGGTDIVLLTTPSKAGWLQDQVDSFNSAQSGKYHIRILYAESRQGMQDIINGKSQPVIWSPSSPIWIQRLSDYSRQTTGTAIVDPSDINSCRVFLRTPLVILTTKEKAPFLKRVFTAQSPWSIFREYSTGRLNPPWGKIKYSHADPLVANSGMLTLGLILSEYADENGNGEQIENISTDSRFMDYLSGIETSLYYDQAAKTGSQPLVNAYADDPESRDFITAYESAALSAATANPDLYVIYPNPTIIAEQMVGVMKANWVTSDQAQGASLFMQQLAGQDSIQDGIKYNMRPAGGDSTSSLASTLQQYADQGFQTSYSRAIEMPSYAALNDAAYQWRIHIAHMPP